MNNIEVRNATFSDDRRYRYALQIVWEREKPMVQFIGLNPSTADEVQDDPTIRRCKRFAADWGYGGIIMTNLFAFRATDPRVMKAEPKPIGEDGAYCIYGRDREERNDFNNRNDFILYETYIRCNISIACWGTHGKHLYRGAKVKLLLPNLKCLAITKDGHPQHPLYLKAELKPIPFSSI